MRIKLKRFSKCAGLLALLTFVLIIVGGATRVTDSGMACPDWPMCYGLLIPFPEPAGGYIVQGVHYQWWQVLLEWGHRLLASVVGLGMLALLIWGTILCKANRKVLYFSILSTLLLASQILLGGLTVLKSNIHWSVAAHLGNALLFFGSLILLRKAAAQTGKVTKPNASGWYRTVLGVFSASVLFTLLLGGMVASSHAGGLCGGLFDCNGQWLPTGDWQQLLHMKHRFMALITVVLMAVLFVISRNQEPALQKSGKGLAILTLTQVAIGIVLLYSFGHYASHYMWLSVFHLAWGTLLWMACIGALAKVYMGLEGGFHDKH